MKYSIRPFQASDLQFTVQREKEIVDFFGIEELASTYQRGPAFTALYNAEPFAMGGVMIIWPGLGEAWAMFRPDFRRHKLFIHRETLRHLKWIAAKHKLKRIQAVADAWSDPACQWLESLQFRHEGEMKEYWNGRTFVRYARIFE